METTVAAETPNAMEGLSKPTFTCFPKLAIEQRLEIFKHAMPGPRRVRLIMKGLGGQTPFLVSDAAVPTLLHVCKESRQEILKHYEQLLSLSKGHHPIYFNFSLDELYFGPQDNQAAIECYSRQCRHQCGPLEFRSFMRVAEEQTLARVERLAVGICMFESGRSYYDHFQGLRHFTGVYPNFGYLPTSDASLTEMVTFLESDWARTFASMKAKHPDFLIPIVKVQYMDGRQSGRAG